MKATTKPTVQRRRLAAKLRNLRAEAGVSPERIMRELDWSRSKLSRIETASNRISVPDVRALCDIYGVDQTVTDGLCGMSKQSRRRGWWHDYEAALTECCDDYLELESEASTVAAYRIDLVPELLQTEEYARSVIRAWAPDTDAETVRQRTEVRMIRQARIADGLHVRAVLDEAALWRCGDSAEILERQLDHLIAMAQRSNVTIRILPFAAGHHVSMGTGFTYLEFAALYDPVVFLDTLTSATYLEDLDEVGHYRAVLGRLEESALNPRDSLAMLENTRQRGVPVGV